MKGKEFDKFCKMLNIYIQPDQTTDKVITQLKGYLKMFYADKGMKDKFVEVDKFSEGKSKEEQKDALFDELIRLKYAECGENAISMMRKKRNRLGENVIPIKDLETEAEEFRRKLDAYYKAYTGEIESAEEVLGSYTNRPMEQQQEGQKFVKSTPTVEKTENTMDRFMKKQKELGQMVTRGVPTIEKLMQQQFQNAIKSDPRKKYKKFTGALYRWAANLREIETNKKLKLLCLMNELDEKNERVVAMRLGTFEYDRYMENPLVEFPDGQYGGRRRRRDFWCDEIGRE